jgi:hypothetical protein
MTTLDAPATTTEQVVAVSGANAKSTRVHGDDVGLHAASNFDMLVGHYYAAQAAGEEDPARAAYQEMLAEWQTAEGSITSAYFCENIRAAAAITDKDCLFSAGDPYRAKADLPLYQLITRASHLEQFAEENLAGPQRRATIAELYAIQTNALACMDELAAKRVPATKLAEELRSVTVSKVEADLAHAEQYAYGVWQRRLQLAYLRGVGIGIVAIAVVITVAAFLLRPLMDAWPAIPGSIMLVPWALLLGAIGAALSVMQRLTRGNLRLGRDTTLAESVTLGAFRPLIGSAFALGILLLVIGTILPLKIPGTEPQHSFFIAGLAFLAGFSERFAQDMVSVAASTQSTAAKAEPSAETASRDEEAPADSSA